MFLTVIRLPTIDFAKSEYSKIAHEFLKKSAYVPKINKIVGFN